MRSSLRCVLRRRSSSPTGLNEAQPLPDVTQADVERVARRELAGDAVPEVLAALDGYGEGRDAREAARVRLAVLKLARGSLEDVRTLVDAARRDFRDVLAAAESPRLLRLPPGRAGAEREAAIAADRAQYQAWLGR